MRRLFVLSLGACVAVGCATRGVPARPPAIPVEVRLAATGSLVRAGCLDCLLDAFREYDALRREPVAADAATAAAARTAVLIALRERELGTLDEGYLNRAR